MQLHTKEQIEEYNQFVMNHPNGHLFQSELWSKVKQDWMSEYIIIRNALGSIQGTACVRIRKIGCLPFSLMYLSRGPVCQWDDVDTLTQISKKISKISKAYRALYITLDPPVSTDNTDFRMAMKNLGFQICDTYSNFEGIQARYVWRIPLTGQTPEQIFSSFSSKHRYNVRLAQRKGVHVEVGSREQIPLFYQLLRTTAQRDGFTIRSISYFYRLYDSLGPENCQLFLAFYQGQCIAAEICGLFSGLGLYLYGASANIHRDCMAPYLIQWNAICWCIAKGAHTYDLRGVPGNPSPKNPLFGLYRFKKGFGGSAVELIGELNYIYHPVLFRLLQAAIHLRKKIYHWISLMRRPFFRTSSKKSVKSHPEEKSSTDLRETSIA